MARPDDGMHNRLLVLFPDYAEGDWELEANPGGVISISAWNRPEPEPTRGQINSVNKSSAEDAGAEARAVRALDTSLVLKAIIYAVADELPLTSRDEFASSVRAVYKSLL